MYDVVVACIRGMKGKRLFNTGSGCLSKGGYCLSVAGFTEYLSVCWLCGTYSYLASHATRGNGHQGLCSIPVSHFFSLSVAWQLWMHLVHQNWPLLWLVANNVLLQFCPQKKILKVTFVSRLEVWSMVELSSSMHKTLGSIPNTNKKKNRTLGFL